MNPLTINHLNIRAALHETESISHVSCKDIRDLLEERNLLLKLLEKFSAHLTEAHEEELNNNHFGDDPADCSYCRIIAEANALLYP